MFAWVKVNISRLSRSTANVENWEPSFVKKSKLFIFEEKIDIFIKGPGWGGGVDPFGVHSDP